MIRGAPLTQNPTSTTEPSSTTQHHRSSVARLRFARSPDGVTYIAEQHVAYPFHVTRPFYLQGDPAGMLTLYLQSVSGGISAHDELAVTLNAEARTCVHVTTQASTIVHSMREMGANQTTHVIAGKGALVEFLPDPLILFPRARIETRTCLRADPSAKVLVCDAFIGHDPHDAGGRFDRLYSELRIESLAGDALCVDRFDISGDDAARASLDGELPAHGILCCVGSELAAETVVSELRTSLEGIEGLYAGASTLPNDCGVWARLVAKDAHGLRMGLLAGWRGLRRALVGEEPAVRRK